MTFTTFSPNITFTIDKFLIFIMWTLTNDLDIRYSTISIYIPCFTNNRPSCENKKNIFKTLIFKLEVGNILYSIGLTMELTQIPIEFCGAFKNLSCLFMN